MIGRGITTWNLIRKGRLASHQNPELVRQQQETGMRRLLYHAYTKVPFYHKFYQEEGFHPDSFRSLDDLHRVPRLSKSQLQQTQLQDLLAKGVPLSKCKIVSTSGSTGRPMQVVLGSYEECWHRAVAWRILFEHGFQWTDRTMEIRMVSGPVHFIQKLGIAPKDWLSILKPPSDWAAQLISRRYDSVIAGAGTLELLADSVAGKNPHPPKMVISDSETLTPLARHRIREGLGTDPIDVYGLAEVSDFAWQCERRDGFHISANSHVVHVVGKPGEPGNLHVTALGMWTMPIINYDTEDLAEFSLTACSCGRSLPLLKTIYGRAVDSVSLGKDKVLLWPFFHELLGENSNIIEWQVRQEKPQELHVHVVLRDNDQLEIEKIQTALQRQLPGDTRILVKAVPRIPAGANGKRRLIIPLNTEKTLKTT